MNDVFAYDLPTLKRFGYLAEQFDKVSDAFVVDASITVASGNGYILGRLYFDSEAEAWRWDLSDNGKDA